MPKIGRMQGWELDDYAQMNQQLQKQAGVKPEAEVQNEKPV